MTIRVLIGVASALLVGWLVLTAVLLWAKPDGMGARSVASFLPQVLRLLRGLYRDPQVPRSVRVRIWVAMAYNLQPFNLIPDFIPVVGFADNLVVIAWALRSAVRAAGPETVVRHWPGDAAQLTLLFRVARLGPLPDVPASDDDA